MRQDTTTTTRPAAHRPEAAPVIDMLGITAASLGDQRTLVAEGVNWRVEAGEFWVVAGLHGSGKTDFLMLVGGVMAPVRGTYHFMGEGMPIFSEERLAHRLKLGLVFDGGRLFNHLTVAENIALPLQYHRNLPVSEIESLLCELLELVGMSHVARKRPSALGRNWQQRAALARALALKPEVLLLDSPLSGLDQRQLNWWLEILCRLSQGHPYYEGKPVTLVATTDNLRHWRARANRFALLNERQLEVLGDWSGVERSGHPLVQELTAAPAPGGGSLTGMH